MKSTMQQERTEAADRVVNLAKDNYPKWISPGSLQK
jgi:hypothetical protein